MSRLADWTDQPSDAVQTRASGGRWEPRVQVRCWASGDHERRLREITPANAVLLRWSEQPQNQPPQEWWDDETDPFAPADTK